MGNSFKTYREKSLRPVRQNKMIIIKVLCESNNPFINSVDIIKVIKCKIKTKKCFKTIFNFIS